MKICFLAHAASIHTRRWTAYFRDRGHQVSLVSLTPANSEPGIDLHLLPAPRRISYERTNWHYLVRLPQLWATVRKIQPDLLNAHFLSSYGLLAALIRPRRCPLVISLHGSDILVIPKRSWLHQQAARFALDQAHLITSVAQHMSQIVVDYVTADKPILTLQYGVDTNCFYPISVDGAARIPLCISNRAMVSTSNLETILLAARALKQSESPLRVQMIGGGDLSADLKKMATELELEDQVSFVGQIVPSQMAETLRSAALYVSMSRSDGTSLSVLEAMACGAFPVVSDIPANREWITNGVNGYLVSPDSATELAEKLDRAWHQPDLRETAAVYNWSLIREKGDYQTNMHRIETAFEALLKKIHNSK